MRKVVVLVEGAVDPLVFEHVRFARWSSSPLLAVAGVDNYLYMELSDGQEIVISRVAHFSVE